MAATYIGDKKKLKFLHKINCIKISIKLECCHATDALNFKAKRRFYLLTDPSAKYLHDPEKLNSQQISVPVWGVTVLDNELFVVSMRLPAMLVYDKTSLVRLRCHEIDQLRQPRDIASIADKRLLYVVEAGGCPYWIHCVKPNGEFVTKWDVGSDPRNLSVANGNEVLVTCNESIKIYTTDGVAIREVRLQSDEPVVWQALHLNTGNYIICQGFQSVTPYHRVSLLQSDGTLTKWFGGPKGAEADKLFNPYQIGVDKDQCVLVADTGNNRVRLFTPKLVHVRDLITSEKVTNGNTANESIAISRHFLDGKSGRMYIGTNSGHLIVFRVLNDQAVA